MSAPTGHRIALIRHGKSDWTHDLPDRERPLAPRGKRQAPEAGRWLREHFPDLDLALVSPATRATATWRLVNAELTRPIDSKEVEDLYTFDGRDLLEVIQDLDEEIGSVALVGHNPALEELVTLLTGHHTTMPTSAIAIIDLATPWRHAGQPTDGSTGGSRGGSTGRLIAAGRPPRRP